MKLPIRDQILWPLMGLLLVAVAANAIFSAWWMSIGNLRALEARQRQIVGVLEESSFPLLPSVIEKLRRLTGDELVIWDAVEHRVVVGTLPASDTAQHDFEVHPDFASEGVAERQTIGGRTYLVHEGRIRGNPSHRLYVLTSDDSIRKASREAIWPPIAVGAVTIILSIPLSVFLASRWAHRIHSIEGRVKSIAQGEFGLELPSGPIDDELARLIQSVNSMSRQLSAMQTELVQGERTRLVAQLAAGFAHQLRNGLTGAKLAVELHESRCRLPGETSLSVARNQLALVAEEVQGLLSLGKSDQRPKFRVDMNDVVRTIQSLVSVACDHQGIHFDVSLDGQNCTVFGFADSLRAAVLNLTLNAIEAAGPGGQVWLKLSSENGQVVLHVEDNGPGPPKELAHSLLDSFVTSKPEGVGLGLTVAATVARTHHGELSWSRNGSRTHFELTLPSSAANIEDEV